MHAGETVGARAADSPTPDEIQAQLQLILSSPVFHGSKRCQQFLEYVCEKALCGETGALKEKSIAIEVFGRRPDAAGQGEDTIVRVGAREVRKRLAQYYVTPEGSSTPILIALAPGAYVPEFHYASGVKTGAVRPTPVEVHVGDAPKESIDFGQRWRSWRLLAAICCLLIVAVAAVVLAKRTSSDAGGMAFQRFWAPVFQSPQPLLIGVGHPIVYLPSHRATLLNEQRKPSGDLPAQRRIELPANELDGSDMVPVENQFVGFGDMVAANAVTQMLARRSLGVRVMFANSIPFADLSGSQAYLIGSFSNQWTVELSRGWRFQFRWTKDRHPIFVDVQAHPAREWSIPSEDNGSTPEDYSLICRVRNSPTGGMLIVSAGIKQFGTEAAGRILADPRSLGSILSKLPKGWEDKNLQILLHTRVLGNTPAQPELVAWQVW